MKDRHFFWMWIVCLYMTGFSLCAMVKGKTWRVSQKELTGVGKGQQVRTIGEAVSLVEPADTVIIHNGIYREKVAIERSGLAVRTEQVGRILKVGFRAAENMEQAWHVEFVKDFSKSAVPK